MAAALLTEEARLTKTLFKLACDATGYGDFTRAKGGSGGDPANRFLDHGNYLAYGLGATTTWVLGLPHGLAVLHGKTRRGGLVFDVADLVKDAVILPQAFRSGIPPMGNEFIAILKDTSLLSILSIRDLTQRMREFQSATFLTFAPYNTVAIVYVFLTLIAASLVARIEHRYRTHRH